jgi:uncharacterized protein (DUF3820 family)
MKTNYREYAHTKMPYGKFKGFYLKDIPDTYVCWAIANIADRAFKEMLITEFKRRYPQIRKVDLLSI